MAEYASHNVINLRSTGSSAYQQLQIALKSVCMVYDVLAHKLLVAMEQSGDDISEGLHSLIFNPLYNTLQIVKNSEHD